MWWLCQLTCRSEQDHDRHLRLTGSQRVGGGGAAMTRGSANSASQRARALLAGDSVLTSLPHFTRNPRPLLGLPLLPRSYLSSGASSVFLVSDLSSRGKTGLTLHSRPREPAGRFPNLSFIYLLTCLRNAWLLVSSTPATMVRSALVYGAAAALLPVLTEGQYTQVKEYIGDSFFDDWNFYNHGACAGPASLMRTYIVRV